jgi:hypothetical protein
MEGISLALPNLGFVAFEYDNTIKTFDTHTFHSKKKVEFVRNILNSIIQEKSILNTKKSISKSNELISFFANSIKSDSSAYFN